MKLDARLVRVERLLNPPASAITDAVFRVFVAALDAMCVTKQQGISDSPHVAAAFAAGDVGAAVEAFYGENDWRKVDPTLALAWNLLGLSGDEWRL